MSDSAPEPSSRADKIVSDLFQHDGAKIVADILATIKERQA